MSLAIEWPTTQASSTPTRRFKTISSIELSKREFPELQYLVAGVIPTGTTLLVAPPKFGKSWLALHLAEACASGSLTLGQIPTQTRPVLYLALEDSARRLKSRMELMGIEPHENLEFATELQGMTLPEILTDRLADIGDRAPLVIIDTLGKVAPEKRGSGSQYSHDYNVLGSLKEIIDQHLDASLLIIHHTNKGEKDDFLDNVSGTQGIAGAADTVIVLKRERGTTRATMQVTSRDVQEAEYSIRFTESCKWILDGSSVEEAKAAAARARATTNLGETSIEILEALKHYPDGITPAELKLVLPQHAENLNRYLSRLEATERIYKPRRGIYTLTNSVQSVSSVQTEHVSVSDSLDESDTPITDPGYCSTHGGAWPCKKAMPECRRGESTP